MALSDLAVRNAKATGRQYTLADSLGLRFLISAAGGKAWNFRHYWLGKPDTAFAAPSPLR